MVSRTSQSWQPDVLGAPFESLTLPLEPDSEGEVVATLVRRNPGVQVWQNLGARLGRADQFPAAGADVLYVHGWSDYFFQRHLAEFWHGAGARFYALDLRKYGRSLRPHQTPGYVESLTEYDTDIDAALEAMGQNRPDSSRPLILMGHSTGGLTLSLWAARNEHRVDALILNSPWLELQTREIGRKALEPLVGLQARRVPMSGLFNLDLGFYSRTTSKQLEGEWDFNPEWRPERSFPVRAGWLRAVMAGHALVAHGLGLTIPVLVMLSATSSLALRWLPEMASSDVVLDVEVVAQRALNLGHSMTMARFDGAIHDILLSARPIRDAAFAEMLRWSRGYLP